MGQLYDLLMKFPNRFERAVDIVNQKIPKKMVKDMQFQIQMAIQDWYSAYDPLLYNRTQRLLNSGHAEIRSKNAVAAFFDTGDIGQHRNLTGEWVADLTIVRGYHGGQAGKDSNGITVSVPTWRTPNPKRAEQLGEKPWNRWFAPAPKTTPPIQLADIRIKQRMPEYGKWVAEMFWREFFRIK